MNHADFEQLAAGFVLGSLEPDDEVAFNRHLPGCVVCQNTVRELESVIGELAYSVPQVEPPRSLRTALRREVGLTSRSRGLLAFRPSLGRPLTVRLAAVAAVLVVFALMFWNMSLRNQVSFEQRQLAELRALASTVNDPQARTVKLTAPGGGAARGTVVASSLRDQAVLVVDDLPGPGPGRVYQVWALPGGDVTKAIPGRTWISSGQVATIRVSGMPIEPGTQFAVTSEPRGGSVRPTLPPVLAPGA
jgi:anti-sigma-K factor RskA